MRPYFLLLAVICGLFVGCNNSTDPMKVMTSQLDSLFNPIYPKDDPGAAILLLKGSDIIYERYLGQATLEPNTPVDENTFFCIASVSKQFSAVAIMKLAQEGKLSLDDPVSKYFPQFRADFFKRITLRHLLSHTSGIPDSRPRTDHDYVYYSTDVESYSYLDTITTLNFEPGTQYEYMNPTFQLMYTIIEKVSGKPFEEYMRTEIFDVAGMEKTLYFEDGRFIPAMSHGYEWNSQTNHWDECDYGETTFFASKADGGIYTNPREFVQWEFALRKNLLLNKEMTQMAHSGKIDTDLPYTQYGYGWFIENKPGFPTKVFHTGDNGGYQIHAGRFPEQEVLFLLFSTRNIDREGTVEKVDQIIKNAGLL